MHFCSKASTARLLGSNSYCYKRRSKINYSSIYCLCFSQHRLYMFSYLIITNQNQTGPNSRDGTTRTCLLLFIPQSFSEFIFPFLCCSTETKQFRTQFYKHFCKYLCCFVNCCYPFLFHNFPSILRVEI